MGMSPMHARLLHMYTRLRDVGHSCKMDNLFNSVNFARQAFAFSSKVTNFNEVLIGNEHYDSKGDLPHHDELALKKDAEEWGADTIGCCPPALPPLSAAAALLAQTPAQDPMAKTNANGMKMTVAILEAELRKRGQKTSGTKCPMQN